MAWSEQIGPSIILPSDVDPDNPDRNYIIIGEDVPAEVAATISAGIVFYNANVADYDDDVVYWVLGINVDGALEMSSYWRQYAGGAPPIYADHITSVFTLTRGLGSDAFPSVNVRDPLTLSEQGTKLNSLTRKDYVDGLTDNGNEAVTITAINTVMTKAVNFNQSFSTPPNVQLTAVSTTPQQITGLGVSGVTTTGFNLHVVRTTLTTTGVNWFASA